MDCQLEAEECRLSAVPVGALRCRISIVYRLHAQSFALNGGRRRIKAASGASGHSVLLSMIWRASFPAHMRRASSWPNALADRELLSWLCLQTRFRQILEGARIVDRLVAKLLQRFSGERRAPA